jgi:hypothetical protein
MRMVSRALGLAAVLLAVCGGMGGLAQAQENLDAGKSPSQLFAGTCSACHKSPRGLLKTVAPGSLPGFLRQHYTTGPEMAGVLSSYLVSNGASDTRYMGDTGRGGKDAKPEAAPSDQADRPSRRRRARATEQPVEAAPGQESAAGAEAGPRSRHHGRKSVKRRHGKPAGDEAAKPDTTSNVNSEGASRDRKVEAEKPGPSEKPAADPAPAAASPTTTQSIAPAASTGHSEPSGSEVSEPPAH